MERYLCKVGKLSDLGIMVERALKQDIERFLVCFCAECGTLLLFDITQGDDNEPLFCLECND